MKHQFEEGVGRMTTYLGDKITAIETELATKNTTLTTMQSTMLLLPAEVRASMESTIDKLKAHIDKNS